jgi:DNA-binding transcriptional regulator YiaG
MPHKKFRELRNELPDGVRHKLDREKQKAIEELPINRLRESRHLTQEQFAQILGMAQPNVSRLERQTDMHLSTLEHIVKAMGGELDIRASFPDGEVVRLSRTVDIA